MADNIFACIARLRCSGASFLPRYNKGLASPGNEQDEQEQDNSLLLRCSNLNSIQSSEKKPYSGLR